MSDKNNGNDDSLYSRILLSVFMIACVIYAVVGLWTYYIAPVVDGTMPMWEPLSFFCIAIVAFLVFKKLYKR